MPRARIATFSAWVHYHRGLWRRHQELVDDVIMAISPLSAKGYRPSGQYFEKVHGTWRKEMGNTYLLLKGLHIVGVIILLGNIMVSAWWKIMAERTRKPSVIAFAQRQITLTDFVFTAPAVLLIIFAGDGMAYGYLSNTWSIQWLIWGRGLFFAAGIIWLIVLIPTQIKQARIAHKLNDADPIPDEYWTLSRRWRIFGTIAVILPLMNIYWMVFKPL